MTHSSVLFVARQNGLVCVMATNILELATTLKYLGAKWLPGKKVNFTPWVSLYVLLLVLSFAALI